MQTKLNPYISFNGNAQDAMEFYKSVFGGKLEMTNYLDGGMSRNADDEKLIMHSQLETENGMTIMAGDISSKINAADRNISISLSGDSETELTAYYKKLSDGGTIVEPLTKAPWGDTFGMFTDRFGINWMVNIAGSSD